MAHDPKPHDKKKKDKDATDPNELWCTDDIDFDEDGCLYIKNPDLARAVQQAIYDTTRRFCICTDDPGAPGNKINAMCPC